MCAMRSKEVRGKGKRSRNSPSGSLSKAQLKKGIGSSSPMNSGNGEIPPRPKKPGEQENSAQSSPQSGSIPRKPDLTVPYELGEAILQYLGTKPYVEVHQFVAGLMRCAQAAGALKE